MSSPSAYTRKSLRYVHPPTNSVWWVIDCTPSYRVGLTRKRLTTSAVIDINYGGFTQNSAGCQARQPTRGKAFGASILEPPTVRYRMGLPTNLFSWPLADSSRLTRACYSTITKISRRSWRRRRRCLKNPRTRPGSST